MRRFIASIIAVVVLPLAVEAQTQTSLTLQAAITRAQSASFMVRLSEADANAAAARARGATSQLLPQFGASGTIMRGGISQLGMPVAQQTYLTTNTSVKLFAPSDIASAAASSHNARAGAYDIVAARNDATYQTIQAYERALLAEAILASRHSTVEYQQRRAADVEIRVKAGAAPRYQRFQAQAALAEASHNLEDANAERDEAVADLEVILDLPVSPSLHLGDTLRPLSIPRMGTVADFQRIAALQRPETLSAEEQLRASGARLLAAREQYSPNVVGSAQTYAGRSNPDLGARGYSLGVTATVQLLDGGMRAAASAEAKAGVERAQVLLDQARRSVERDVYDAYREYDAAEQALHLARAQTSAAAEELRISILRERNGKGIALETLAAIADAATARENEMRATARFNDAIAGLYHASASDLPTELYTP